MKGVPRRWVLWGVLCHGCFTAAPTGSAAKPDVKPTEAALSGVDGAESTASAGQPTLPKVSLSVGSAAVQAEVADSPEERRQDLMFRPELVDGAGMLFVYPSPRRLSFWMRNTAIPLSIAFIDESGTILRISELRPLDERHVPSDWPALYALEVPRGWFERAGVSLGDRVGGLPGPSPQ